MMVFNAMSRQFPEALVCRCLAFEPSEQHLKEEVKNLKDLEVLPIGESL